MLNSRFITATLLVLLLIGSASRVFRPNESTKPAKNQAVVSSSAVNPHLATTTVTINGQTFSAEIAQTVAEQTQGLSDRASLGPNQAMLFPISPPGQPSFWMKGMRFPLDIIWISDGRVIGVSRNLPPPAKGTPINHLPMYPAPGLIDSVLEVNAGAAQTIKSGDSVVNSSSQRI